ncbi:MAG TPA: chemotaxis protein CheW [Rhizomicrobium sp.]|nr:chemotaxis protein CheW [Rhizomicrobium sp.]
MSETDPASPQAGPTRHFLTFRVLDRLYALPASDVTEVIRVPPVARMPQAPKGLMGLANLRGEILPVASSRNLLGQTEMADMSDARAIVMHGASPVALAVDSVADLLELPDSDIERQESKLSALPGEILVGAFQHAKGGQIVKLLDIDTLLRAAFVPQAWTQHRVKQQASLTGTLNNADGKVAAQSKLVAFAIAGQEYALPLEIVQEIVAAPSLLATVPHSDAVVLGVTSLRDTLLPLLSLRALLGFGNSTEPNTEKVVIATVQGNLVGLVVDEMRAIFAADETRIDPIPEVLAARTRGESRIAGIYRGHQGQGLISILSSEQIFGDDVMQHLTAAREHAQIESMPTTVSATRQFLIFRLGNEEFALPIEAVEEVARVPEQIARVPNTPKFLEGVVNLRGEVLPVVDQRKRFQMPSLADTESRRLVVVRTARHIAGLIVDSVSEVLRTGIDDIDLVPDLTGETAKLVAGVVNLESQGRIILLLDPEELLTRAEKGLLDKFSKQQSAPGRPQA